MTCRPAGHRVRKTGNARPFVVPSQKHRRLPVVFVIIDSYILYCTFVQLSIVFLFFLKHGDQLIVWNYWNYPICCMGVEKMPIFRPGEYSLL